MKPKTILLMTFSLVASSLLMFALHYLLFHDLHHLAIYTVHDLAFLPLEVLIVSLFLHRIIESEQKKEILEKMNIAIGTFFSDCGTALLQQIISLDRNAVEIHLNLLITPNWKNADYKKAHKAMAKHEGLLEFSVDDLQPVKSHLESRRKFILRLLENPNLLEHEGFTNLLWAVFHLTEELIARDGWTELPEIDLKHISMDITRVYRLLLVQWLNYMEHLQKQYPFLFSMAVRTNPLDSNAEVIFR